MDPAKIDLIPHGVIDLPFIDSNFYKDVFGVEGKTVLLTFGLSDTVCTITPVALDELLGALQWNPGAPGGGGTAWAARQLTGRVGPARPPGAAPQ